MGSVARDGGGFHCRNGGKERDSLTKDAKKDESKNQHPQDAFGGALCEGKLRDGGFRGAFWYGIKKDY